MNTTTSNAATIHAMTLEDWKREPGYQMGYAAGLAEGQRKERRALRAMVRAAMSKQGHNYCTVCWYLGEIILEWLASRAKRKKRHAPSR